MPTYFRVEVDESEGGGLVPRTGGNPGGLLPGSMFHVLKDAVPGDTALVVCHAGGVVAPSGWVEQTRVEAEAVFAGMYGRAPSAAEVP